MKFTGIVDYGSGNFNSVLNAVKAITNNIKIISQASDFEDVDKIILPGVGTFKAVMEQLNSKHLVDPLNLSVRDGNTDFLGICVGMQILVSFGQEIEEWPGLNYLDGQVSILDVRSQFYLPHIGWNEVSSPKDMTLFTGIDDNASFYFVHSYHVNQLAKDVQVAHSKHDQRFVAALSHKNIHGVQFHPEKSQHDGLKLLENFISLC